MSRSRNSHRGAIPRGLSAALCSAALLFFLEAPAQAQSALTHHVRPAVVGGQAHFLNPLPATESLRLHIVLPLRDQAGLERFLREVDDPASPSYRHFLTVQEFTARFGPSQEDYDAVRASRKRTALRWLAARAMAWTCRSRARCRPSKWPSM